MNDTTHTPGPWSLWGPGGAYGEQGTVTDNKLGRHIARILGGTPHTEGNTNLIVAAPDLLAAAKGALAALTQPSLHPADVEAARIWLREAINKIEQEE